MDPLAGCENAVFSRAYRSKGSVKRQNAKRAQRTQIVLSFAEKKHPYDQKDTPRTALCVLLALKIRPCLHACVNLWTEYPYECSVVGLTGRRLLRYTFLQVSHRRGKHTSNNRIYHEAEMLSSREVEGNGPVKPGNPRAKSLVGCQFRRNNSAR
jgi:hypothetical protein